MAPSVVTAMCLMMCTVASTVQQRVPSNRLARSGSSTSGVARTQDVDDDDDDDDEDDKDDEWSVVYPPEPPKRVAAPSSTLLFTSMRGGIRVSLEVTCSSYSRDQAGLHLQCTRAVWVFARDGEGASSKRRPLRFAQAPMRSLALLSAPHFEAYVADRLEVAAYHQTRRVNGSGVCKTLKVKGEERATTTKAALCPAVEQHVVAPRAVVRLVVDQLREDEITAVMRPAVEQPVVAAPRVVVSPVAELPVVAPRVVASPVVELPVVAPRTSVQPVVELPLVAPRTSVRPAVLRRPSARSAQVCPLPINHQQDARYMAYKQSQAYNEKREACLARRRAGEDRLGLQAAKTKADEAAAQARKQVAKAPTRIQKVSSRVLAYENTPAYMEARKRNQIRRAKLQSARG